MIVKFNWRKVWNVILNGMKLGNTVKSPFMLGVVKWKLLLQTKSLLSNIVNQIAISLMLIKWILNACGILYTIFRTMYEMPTYLPILWRSQCKIYQGVFSIFWCIISYPGYNYIFCVFTNYKPRILDPITSSLT